MRLDCPFCRKLVDLPADGGSGACPACGAPVLVRVPVASALRPAAPAAQPPPDPQVVAHAHTQRGLAAARAGDYVRAVAEFTAALRFVPAAPRVLNNRG